MSFLVTIAVVLVSASNQELPSPAVSSGGSVVSGSSVSKSALLEKQNLDKLIAGIKALEFQGLSLSDEKREAIASAVLEIGTSTGVDPFFLLALARMESDFVSVARVNYQCRISPKYICSADCGITQHHVTGPGKWVQRYCTTLQKDFKMAFQKSAEEIVRHVEWCQKHSANSWWGPLELCVLNRYNQGPYYRRDSECEKIRGEYGEDPARIKEQRRRCLIRAAYWKRVLCFYYGAQSGKKLQRSCRYCMSLKDIPWFYGEKIDPSYKAPPVFEALRKQFAQPAAIASPAPAVDRPAN